MIAGASPSANSRFSVKSPWITCDGAAIGARIASSRARIGCETGGASSSHATRSPIDQGFVRRSRNDGRASEATAAWKRSPTSITSTHRSACAPATTGWPHHPSTTHRPSVARIGSASRNPSCATVGSTAPSHVHSASSSHGLRTMSATRQERPSPPPSATGSPMAPKASSTAGGWAHAPKLPARIGGEQRLSARAVRSDAVEDVPRRGEVQVEARAGPRLDGRGPR